MSWQKNPILFDVHRQPSKIELKQDASAKRSSRLRILQSIICLWVVLLVGKLYYLQLSDLSTWRSGAVKQHVSSIELASERGAIFDRFGRMLAVSVPTGSVWARPNSISDKNLAAEKLATLLEASKEDILSKLSSGAPFVWIKRQIPRVKADQIIKAGLDGVGYFIESRRYYPYNHAASRLLGRVGTDGQGLSGIEALHEAKLQGENLKVEFTRDGVGQAIASLETASHKLQLPKGESIELTIDAELQMIVDQELEKGWSNANSQAALAVMIDADTGEILAMSQSAPINFNIDKVSDKGDLTNLVVETVFEPGSILKPMVIAGAIEAGVISGEEVIDCEQGRFRFGKHTIRDVKPNDTLSVEQVVVKSSNIGMSKIGQQMGKELLYKTLSSFGFGQDSALNLAGESAGILRPVHSWAAVDVATHSFGQGVAITPLQMVRAISAIANGGELPELSIIKQPNHGISDRTRVLSTRTANRVQEMMYSVVGSEGGTGFRARIPGVKIGGKTGTAQRAREDGRGYEPDSYISSFVGFADATELGIPQKLALLVVIDRPDTDTIYGGTLAAPVFQKIIQRSLSILGGREALDFPDSAEYNQPYQEMVPEVPSYSDMIRPVSTNGNFS